MKCKYCNHDIRRANDAEGNPTPDTYFHYSINTNGLEDIWVGCIFKATPAE